MKKERNQQSGRANLHQKENLAKKEISQVYDFWNCSQKGGRMTQRYFPKKEI